MGSFFKLGWANGALFNVGGGALNPGEMGFGAIGAAFSFEKPKLRVGFINLYNRIMYILTTKMIISGEKLK